jgi:hypothetical protein
VLTSVLKPYPVAPSPQIDNTGFWFLKAGGTYHHLQLRAKQETSKRQVARVLSPSWCLFDSENEGGRGLLSTRAQETVLSLVQFVMAFGN